jgi:hypothetical protein
MSTDRLTHLFKPGSYVSDLRLRCGLPAKGTDGLVTSEDSIGQVDCAGCLRDVIADLRREIFRLSGVPAGGHEHERAMAWLTEGGDTGTSSLTIWSVMTGLAIPTLHGGNDRRADVPHDPADFGRCHRLLDLFPQWRKRLAEVADRYPEWSGLVDAWDELTELYLAEYSSGRAPRCYARMREILGGDSSSKVVAETDA